ncbi:7631_t:CDS:2 [Funneliformis caledonium]|uniref:7631_t:CDS:1 n=1 Tax=Funneliformis caledonium TaxID=1117310 RepID=A0A9N8WKC2_9GLOM|nr:7631_t:CDS:2 [Funneliformis caledonium]
MSKSTGTRDPTVIYTKNEKKKHVIPADNSSIKKNRHNRFKQERKSLIDSHHTISCAATSNLKKAIQICKNKVEKIAKEHRDLNRKFRDREFDLLISQNDCIYGKRETDFPPSDVKRISKIFKNPQFFVNGVEPNDIKQGFVGDCWFVAALGVVTNIPGLLETICVARDEEVGIYGFIFFKDGDWISTVVDDQLCTYGKDENGKFDLTYSENETWLPLIEKAYAKIHGDYESIEGGWTAIEDLTGGVYTFVRTDDILDTEKFWREELVHVNKKVLFAVSHITFDPSEEEVVSIKGLYCNHAYSVIRTIEIENGTKLVEIRNPHGTGPWSDGSKEWSPERMTLLNHQFGDDGAFWMSYEDFLNHWNCIDKVRLFDSSWTVYTTWIKYNVLPKSDGKFILTIPQESELVIVLQQPDNRYFTEDQKYKYLLSFRVYEQGSESYLSRSQIGNPYASRSINQEINLPAGTYEIIPHITRRKERRVKKLAIGQDVNDNSDDEEEEHEKCEWELSLGIRIYSQNRKITLKGYEGEYPKKVEPVQEEIDPEGDYSAIPTDESAITKAQEDDYHDNND